MTPITEELLRLRGFKWHEVDRSISKHWLLWLGDVIPDDFEKHRVHSNEDLGIELTKGDAAGTWWYCWLRADYAGRYSRCICLGHYTSIEQLITVISALSGQPFDAANAMYGSLRRPEVAARLRKEDESLHQRLARDWAPRAARDEGIPFDKDQSPKNGVRNP